MEEYKIIKDSNYSISNLGNVKNTKTGRILKQNLAASGYFIINIYINKKRKSYIIHRLMGIYFIENPNNLYFIDHIDRNKLNNNINNLRWINRKENNNNRKSSLNKKGSVRFINGKFEYKYWLNTDNKLKYKTFETYKEFRDFRNTYIFCNKLYFKTFVCKINKN